MATSAYPRNVPTAKPGTLTKPYYDPIVAPLPKGVYQDPVSSPWNLANIPGTKQWQDANARLTGTYGVAPGTVGAPAQTGQAPAVSAPAPAPKPGFWTTPDYAGMIPGDWEVTGAEAAGRQATGEAESAFQKSLRQAFIDFGGDASKLGDYSKYIDAPTIEAAQQNKFSAVSQALQAMTRTLRQQRAARAARGMSTSGAAVGQTRRTLEAREQADYNALRGFLGGAEQGESGLASLRRDIADKIAAARSSAGARLAASNPAYYTPGEEAQVPAATTPSATTPAVTTPAWGGISWGGVSGIKTKAQLQRALGYNQSLQTWARQHPDAWARLG
jgi:hypothetical protein